MQGHESDVDGWYKTFFKGQREAPGKCTVSVAQFDSHGYDVVVEWADVRAMPESYRLVPRGGTPLLDSLAKSIVTLGEKLSSMPESERPEKVIVVVQTDGEENQSKEWTKEKVKALVKRQREEYSWEFLFLGADIDAFGDAGDLGIGAAMRHGHNQAGYAMCASLSSDAVRRYRGGASGQSLSFTPDELALAESTVEEA